MHPPPPSSRATYSSMLKTAADRILPSAAHETTPIAHDYRTHNERPSFGGVDRLEVIKRSLFGPSLDVQSSRDK